MSSTGRSVRPEQGGTRDGETLAPGRIADYLERIGVSRNAVGRPDADLLRELHEHHLRAVPFDNSRAWRKEKLRFDVDSLYTNIVLRGRGGICYELNILFAALLRSLGYSATFVVGEMRSIDTRHLMLLVEDIEGSVLLCDVGYGCYFVRPIPFHPESLVDDSNGRYRLVGSEEGWVGVERHVGDSWRRIVDFPPRPAAVGDIEKLWEEYESRPDAIFTRALCVQIRSADGWVTINGEYLIEQTPRGSDRRRIDERERAAVLRSRFGLTGI